MRALAYILGLILVCAMPCHAGWILDGMPGAPEGGTGGVDPGDGAAISNTYPVLRLDLGGQWTDFELKASTNNFTNLVYYVKSSGASGTADDADLWIYFTDDYAVDVRQWKKAARTSAIGSQLANTTNSEVEAVIVCPSHAVAVDWQSWMSPTNSRLVWAFVRYDGIDLEMNADGTKTHWNPVVPVEWRTTRIAP